MHPSSNIEEQSSMLTVSHVVKVADEKCIGCKACDRVCPTQAIVTIDKLAIVYEDKCTGCNKCIEACMDHGAISRKFLDKEDYRVLAVDLSLHPQEKIDALCKKARFHPNDVVCPCTGTTAAEVAVAILEGANAIDDITLKTGVRGVCSMWCTTCTIRIMEAAGMELPKTNPKNWRIYPDGTQSGVSVWGVSNSIADKYPEYRLHDAKTRLDNNDHHLPAFPRIRGDGIQGDKK